MRKMKALFVLFISLFLFISLCSCGSSGRGYQSRVVQISAPLKEPRYLNEVITIAPFQAADPLRKSDFIFKGRIDKIKEVHIKYQAVSSTKTSEPLNQWLSSCEITIENTLYGEIPGIKNKIKAVFQSSSRGVMFIDLKEGQEYYFLTHIFSEQEKNNEYDAIKMYQFGDVQGSTIYNLMPVSNGVVSFREGWPLTGAALPVEVKDIEANIETIDEKSFLEQIAAMIRDSKKQG